MALTAADLDQATQVANAGGSDTSSAGLLNVAQGVHEAYAKPEPTPAPGATPTVGGVSALHDEAPHDAREDDLGEAAKVAGYQFANQALFGVPQIIADHYLDKKTLKEYEDMRDRHPVANYGAGAAGMGASFFIGGPLFKAAAKAGTMAHGLVLGAEAGEDIARSADVMHGISELTNPVAHAVGDGVNAAGAAAQAIPKATSALGDLGAKAMTAAHEAVTEHLADALGDMTKASPDMISQALMAADPAKVADFAAAAARTAAPGLGKKILAKAVQYGVEGAVLSAPQTLTNAAMGDLKHAGESLAMGAGLNLALGGGLGAISKAGEFGTDKLSKLTAEDLHSALEMGAKSIAKSATHTAGAIMGLHGHLPGMAMSFAAEPMVEGLIMKHGTRLLGRLAKTAEDGQFGMQMAKQVQGYLQTSLDGLQDGITSAAIRAVPSHDPVRDVLGVEANGLSKEKQWDRMTDKLSTLDPDQHMETVAPLFHAIPNAAHAASQTFKAQVGYLQKELPRPEPPQPFSNMSTSTVTQLQKQDFNQKLSVTLDPTRALGHLKAGTLTQNHVDALQATSPDFYAKASASLLASKPNPKMTIAQHNQVAMFLGQPVTPSLRNMTLLSTMAQNNPSPGGGDSTHASTGKSSGKARAGTMKDMPSMQTTGQRINSNH